MKAKLLSWCFCLYMLIVKLQLYFSFVLGRFRKVLRDLLYASNLLLRGEYASFIASILFVYSDYFDFILCIEALIKYDLWPSVSRL